MAVTSEESAALLESMAFIYHPGAGRDVYVCYALALILLFVVAVLYHRQKQRGNGGAPPGPEPADSATFPTGKEG